MNKYKMVSLTLSVVCFAIVWSINENLLSLFTVAEKPNLSFCIRFVSSIGIFALLFQLIMWGSQIVTQRWLSDEAKITGYWYQIFHIHNYKKSENDIDAIRHGPVSINFEGSFLEISATNLKIGTTKTSSSWYSNKVSLQGSQLWLLFSSTGPGRGSTYGNMLYHFQGNRPMKLVGQFSDSSPATHYGSIELYRNKDEYKNRLQQFIEKKV